MKVTSEQLLELFGLKVGQFIRVKVNPEYDMNYGDRIYAVIDSANGYLPIVQENQDWHLFLHMIIDNEWEYEIVDYKPTPKLTEDEKVILRNLPIEYKGYIARYRDTHGFSILIACKTKPIKDNDLGVWSSNNDFTNLPYDHLFQFITWEDEEPYNIKELLDE